MLLADLIGILLQEVPAANDVPSSAQYEQAVKDAVVDFSRRCGLAKMAELSIISGTATYSLPADFMKLIWLEALTGADGVIISDGGIIPISADWEEKYTIANKQIKFYPTPSYTMAREFRYKSAWVSTTDDYTTLGEDEAQIVLLRAKSVCLGKQVNAESAGMKYSLGAVSVDQGSSVDAKRMRADNLEQEYTAACEAYNGAVYL